MLSEYLKAVPLLSAPQARLYIDYALVCVHKCLYDCVWVRVRVCVFVCTPACLSVVHPGQ